MNTANDKKVKEVWKSPPSLCCTRFQVSSLGRIRTLDYERRFMRLGKRQVSKIKGRVLKPAMDSRGRFFIGGGLIRKEWIGKGFLLHRLVAECFVANQNPEEYKLVFFKNGDISDCRASNLEWGDRGDWGKIQSKRRATYRIKVLCNGLLVGEFDGYREAGIALGTSKQCIQQAISNGHLCRGFQLVRTETRGEKPYFGIENVRKSKHKRLDTFEIPNELYTQDIVKLKHKAVF